MLIFLYQFVFTLVLLLLCPFLLLTRKDRFIERLALNPPLSSFKGNNVWIHALSVGEVISALPLVKIIREKYPEKDIVFTVSTSKGMEIAKSELGEGDIKALLFMPIDLWWCVRRIVNYIRPSIFFIVETDLWPGLINYLKKRGIKSILVNGRISPGTFKQYRGFPLIARKMFEALELCLMQTDLDRERLLRVGIGPPTKIRTVGNIKFDREWIPMGVEERLEWLQVLGLEPENIIWVAGSTHRGEEEIILRVFKKLRPGFPALRLILAPRKIGQSEDIEKTAKDMGLNASLRTEASKNPAGAFSDVLILNTLGELGRIYGLGKVSFVGGSLVPFGGHNLLEPASFACPVLFGPYTHNFVLMSDLLVETGGGLRVRDEKELHEDMKMLLKDEDMCNRMGILASEFVKKNKGALKRIISNTAIYMDETGGVH